MINLKKIHCIKFNCYEENSDYNKQIFYKLIKHFAVFHIFPEQNMLIHVFSLLLKQTRNMLRLSFMQSFVL